MRKSFKKDFVEATDGLDDVSLSEFSLLLLQAKSEVINISVIRFFLIMMVKGN